MDETMNTEALSTTSEQTETHEATEAAAESATASQEQTSAAEGAAQSGEGMSAAMEQEEQPYMIARFNHEDKPLSREEATNWAQLGMKHQALFDRLDYIAAQSDTTVDALIDGMLESMENTKRTELKERFGEDESVIEDLMTLYRNGQKEKYEKVKQGRAEQAQKTEQSTNARIASEFSAMKKDFPELTDFASLPTEVKRAAADGMPLAYAYLMHNHTESRKSAAAAKQAEQAAKKSTGSMASDERDGASEADKRFLAALWGD